MGLFNFNKKEKKKQPKKEEEPELSQDGIVFRAIIELMGSPKKYIEDTTNAFIENIKKNQDYKILKSKISKPKKVKDESIEETKEREIFSTFAEVEVLAKKKEKIFDFCFNYMPSSVEIIKPMSLEFTANEISNYLSDIQATLHKIDFALKNANAANQVMNTRLQNLTKSMVRTLRNNILLSLREKNKDLKEISKNVGISEDQLKPFVDNMIKENEIKHEGGKYSVVK